MNKIFAIGDIHGCLEKLQALIQKIEADSQKDTIIFIGDYIDRGSSSREVVDYVIQLKNEFKKVICLLGNHEHMLMQYLEGVDEEIYLSNGGSSTLFSYGILNSLSPKKRREKIPQEHLQFLQSLSLHYETKDNIFVHAGLTPGLPLNKQTTHDLLWIRETFIHTDYDFGRRVIFGHTPLSSPLIMKNKIGIDTGAVYGGKLTCLELPKVKIYQV